MISRDKCYVHQYRLGSLVFIPQLHCYFNATYKLYLFQKQMRSKTLKKYQQFLISNFFKKVKIFWDGPKDIFWLLEYISFSHLKCYNLIREMQSMVLKLKILGFSNDFQCPPISKLISTSERNFVKKVFN